MNKHTTCVEAVFVIIQYAFENGSPPYMTLCFHLGLPMGLKKMSLKTRPASIFIGGILFEATEEFEGLQVY